MSNNVFEFKPDGAADAASSPFSVVPDSASAASPFSAAAAVQSPFTAMANEAPPEPMQEPGKPAKIPPPRGQVADFATRMLPDQNTPFGYDALAGAIPPQQPFSPAQQADLQSYQQNRGNLFNSPFGFVAHPQESAFSHAMPSSVHTPWQPPAANPLGNALPGVEHAFANPQADSAPRPFAPSPAPSHSHLPVEAAPAPVATPYSDARPPAYHQPSAPMQLELRAIFGLDRNLSAMEILQRCRTLPGVRHIVQMSHLDLSALETLRHHFANAGLTAGDLRLFVGNSPVEFISEGSVVLAVSTDGSFAPGVKETVIIAARELAKLA